MSSYATVLQLISVEIIDLARFSFVLYGSFSIYKILIYNVICSRLWINKCNSKVFFLHRKLSCLCKYIQCALVFKLYTLSTAFFMLKVQLEGFLTRGPQTPKGYVERFIWIVIFNMLRKKYIP